MHVGMPLKRNREALGVILTLACVHHGALSSVRIEFTYGTIGSGQVTS